MKTPEPASNEEIERRIKAVVDKMLHGDVKHQQWLVAELTPLLRDFASSLPSELKAQNRITDREHLVAKSKLDKNITERECFKPVDESLDEAAKNSHPIEWDSLTSAAAEMGFKAGASYGEAKGWRDAIEHLDTHENSTWTYKLKEEAKRRGFI